ncbi:MAG: GIY-YIG nuclease family protein [Chitinophagaceae bacterium]|nr:GIY-YIG nuclease family protein [Chitinophagaceae bacterium]
MHFVYIIHSDNTDKYYVGESQDVVTRNQYHIEHKAINSYTKIAEDWKIMLTLTVKDRSEARRIEKYIKSMKSSAFLKKLITVDEFLAGFIKLVKDKLGINIIEYNKSF